MAITVTQSPNKLNASYTNLVFTVSSNLYNQPQFQYVMDVVSGSTVLSRIRQYPNPAGDAVFDPSNIIQDYLEYQDVDYSQITDIDQLTTDNAVANEQLKIFSVKFGEEYGSSISSSVTLYTGTDAIGNPAVVSSNDPYQIFPAQVDYNDYWQATTGIGYNFFTGSRVESTGESMTFGYNKFLSYQPEKDSSERTNDSMTIAYGDNGFIQIIVNGSLGSDVEIDTTGFRSNGTSIAGDRVVLSGLDFPAMITVPISPIQQGWSLAQFNEIERFRVIVTNNVTLIYDIFNIFKDNEDCNYNRVGIQFINELGAWDYYAFSLPSRQTINVERDNYEKPFVDYSSGVLSQFNPRRGGTTSYNTSTTKVISFTTPYLSQKQAHFVEQIFTSPKIRLLYPEGLNNNDVYSAQPMAVTLRNSSFVRNTNSRGQKLFQFNFDFELSNNPAGR